jgi:large subunit ribosomal protein L1
LEALLVDLKRMKPTAAKGIYIKKITLSSTMGPGLWLDPSSLNG